MGQSRQRMTQGQADAFDESRVECAGETERLEAVGEVREVAQTPAAFDPSESAATIGFLDLAVQQVECHLPTEFARRHIRDLLTQMGGDGIEVEVEAVAGENRQTAQSQDERNGVKQSMGHGLGAWTELKRGDEFGGWIKGDPPPQIMRLVTQGGEQLIQLQMTQVQVAEEMGVHLFSVLSRPRQPKTNRHLRMLEEQGGIGDRQTQVHSQEDPRDLRSRRAQMIQRRAAPAGKAFAASLTSEPLDATGTALAVTDQGMESGIGVAVIVALRVEASVFGRTDGLTLAAGAFCVRSTGGHPACPTRAWDAGDRGWGNRSGCAA
jgi:hypothetical protein